MKLFKIFFITIVSVSITSCSSEDDPQISTDAIDNSNQVELTDGNNNPDVNLSDHLITTPSESKVSSLLMSSDEYNNWKSKDQFTDGLFREAIIKDIYKQFSDNYDFIILMLNEEEIPDGINYYGKNVGVSNNISGIGGDIYDYSTSYGSSGKLKSVMQLSALSFLQNGPALHELMHNWGNYALPTENINETGDNLNSYSYYGHWGFTGGSTKGQLGGFKQSTLEELGNSQFTVDSFGSFANGGNAVPYNELELYLMGMIPVSSVNSFDLFNDITSFNVDNNKFTFTANKVSYGPNELESLLGTRIPNSSDSQKEFDILIVVLTDNSLTDTQWTNINDAAKWFSFKGADDIYFYNFWEATNGIGTINIGN